METPDEHDAEREFGATADALLDRQDESSISEKVADLAARIQFFPNKGQIWLDDRRMGLIYCDVFGGLRGELIDRLGIAKTRAIFTQMGYRSGVADAEVSRKVRQKGEVFDAFAVGPQLHGLEGFVRVEKVIQEIDVEAGRFNAEYLWHDSFEAQAHLSARGQGADPVCWMQTGYAAGFASAFIGREILYKEVQCMGMGHDHCHIVGKPVDDWEDAQSDLHFILHDQEKLVSSAVKSSGIARKIDQVAAPELVGASTAFTRAFHLLKKAAISDINVLLAGEFGVGKYAFARHLHRLSSRKGSQFVLVNCATIDPQRFDSDLFGVAKGVISESALPIIGPIERAHGGTLFLNNVEDLPPIAQAKVLQFMQTSRIRRLGSGQDKEVNVRIVAASCADLRVLVREGKFSEGLYQYLHAFPINIAPLRDRRADLSMVIEKCLTDSKTKNHKDITGFTNRALAAAMAYEWPGNIWEVVNRIERAVVLCEDGEAIGFSHLFPADDKIDFSVFRLNSEGELQVLFDETATPDGNAPTSNRTIDAISSLIDQGVNASDVTDLLIRNALRRSSGNQSAAARLLGMSRSQIQYRLKQMNNEGGDMQD